MTERAVSTARDGVLALDSEWRVTRANDEAGVILGQPAPALVGRSFWELVPESLGRVDEAACRRAQETGEALTLEIESADSAWRLAAVPVTGGVCVVLTDVTGWGERRWTEETSPQGESFYRQILESIPGMVFTTRADGYCDYQSRQWVEYTGVPMGEQLGDGWNSLLHPEDQARAFAAWQEAVAGRAPYDLEYRVRRLDGRYEWFRVVGRPLRDPAGRIVRWFGVALNIQDLKRTEVQLRQAKAQLEEADRRKDEFLAVLSHELRNPLAPILNGAYILERALPGGEQARRAREIIERNALQLTRLVDDLLEVTRITRGKFQLQRQEVDLATLVRRSVDDHRGVFAAAGVALDCDAGPAPVWVDGDPARLCQVLGNLLSNAAKFTQRGGRTQVSVVVSDGRAEVRVRDTGVGIGPELLPRVFEPFVQGESTLDRSRGGLGLGLPVLKGLVMLHGGTVTAHSEGAGRGAEFVVTLPTSSSRPDSPRSGPGACASASARRVLIVEDNADAAETLRSVLELQGHVVDVARDGEQGIALARELRPDTVLCDLGLPGINGFAVARALRSDPELSQTRLVALSGYAQPEDVERALEAGFDSHLAKPVDPARLADV